MKIENYFNRRYVDFLMVMTDKELKARYKNTIFGFLWAIINPLFQMLVIGFVFSFFIKEQINNYFLYLFVGLLIWNFFSLTLNKTTPSIINERSLIKKAVFPREVIPLSIIISNFINMIITFTLLVPLAYYFGINVLFGVMGILIGTMLLLAFTIGLSLLTSALNVRFRDMAFIIQAALIPWFYATPIVYSIAFIPHDLIWIWQLNPLVSIIQLFQNALAGAPSPDFKMLFSNILITLATLIVGIYIFGRESKNFDDWV